jgi:NAD(P)-dependent dehydrogenase (short-subunit alcohol dehydrogenase family)
MGFDINGTTALVTGANRGIGKTIVESLVQHGAGRVYAAVRNPETALPLVESLGSVIEPIEFDLSRVDLIEAAAQAAGDVNLVINNAGVLRTAAPMAPDAIDSFEVEMRTNVYGLMHTARVFAPVLKRNGGGAFVQLNSVASMKSFPAFSTYCASKAAAYSITQALRAELGEQGTQVVSVHPGPIATDMASEAGLEGEPPSVVAEAIIEGLREGRFHVFPDAFARQVGDAYASFSDQIIEADLFESAG